MIRIIVCSLLLIVITGALTGYVLFEPTFKISGFKTLDKSKLLGYTRAVRILDDKENEVMGAIYEKNRIYTPIYEINDYTKNAFIAVEDKRFYAHHGVDYIRILSAFKNNIVSGSFREGASTISQQLIKNTHLSNEKTIKRKIQEIRIARDLERNYSKDQILEMYLNSLYFGNGIYGIGSASQIYYGVSAQDLTLSQSALIAGIINSPSRYDVYRNYDNAIKRRNSVLGRMLSQNMISKNEYDVALKENVKPIKTKPLFNQYVNATLNDAINKLNVKAETLYCDDWTISTYCNDKIQNKTEKIISDYQLSNGEISVCVSRNNDGAYIVNASTALSDNSHLCRQPGSTIKPFVCYAPLIESNKIYTCTPILDEKTEFGDYHPSNYNDKYYGWTSVEKSLANSLNIPAIKLMEMNGVENSINFARKFGLKFNTNDNSLSVALGGLTDGFTLFQIVDAYRVFANNGKLISGKFVKKIVDKNGNNIFNNNHTLSHQIISPQTAYLMNTMLNACAIDGTGKKVGKKHPNACVKTGTVGNKNGNSDTYCIAYTPKYTLGVRISSTNQLLDNKITGGGLCAEIANKVLAILGDNSTFEVPNGIVYRDIDLRELNQNNKVVLAGDKILPINRKPAIFSTKKMPKEYSQLSTFNENGSILDDFNNFKIIDGVFD